MSRERPASQAGLFARKGTAKPAGLIDRSEEMGGPQSPAAAEAPGADEAAVGPETETPTGPEDELEPAASLLTIGVRWSRRDDGGAVREPPAPVDRSRADEAREPSPESPAEPAAGPASEPPAAAKADEATTEGPPDSFADLAPWTTGEPREAPAEAAWSSAPADQRRPMTTAWLGTAVVAVLVIACAVLFGLAWYLHSDRISGSDGNADAPTSSVHEPPAAAAGSATAAATAPPPPVDGEVASPQPPPRDNLAPSVDIDDAAATPAPQEEATRFPPPAGIGEVIPTTPVDGVAAVRAADAPTPSSQAPSATLRPGLPPKGPIYTVQLASVGTARHIGREWQRLQQALPDVLRGLSLRIEQAEVDGVGRVYRLRTGAFAGYSEAHTFCGRVEARGASCLVVRW